MSYGPAGTAVRLCDWPPCDDSYDAAAVLSGEARALGWFQHPTFSLHMCGQHAPLTLGTDGHGGGPHCPRLFREPTIAVCSCAEPLPGSTLGEMTAAYITHLAAELSATRHLPGDDR